jgi:hypothetical protein
MLVQPNAEHEFKQTNAFSFDKAPVRKQEQIHINKAFGYASFAWAPIVYQSS